MKKITQHLMPRYMWFMIWFRMWFRNLNGIKGFSVQVMNWLLQDTMALAKRLNNQNKKMAEAIKSRKAKLTKWYEHPTVDADEWDNIKNKVRKLGIWIFMLITTEAACNYFAIESVMEGKGWFWTGLRILVGVVTTGGCIYLFERWLAIILNKPAYKKIEAKKRNWIELVVLTCICIGIEFAFYWLCKRRSVTLEGASEDDTITNFLLIFGLLLPIFTGYLAYERSRYITAYRNTLRITNAEKEISMMELKIASNNQRMQDHFKRELQDRWAVLDEFKIYKGNYNLKNSIPEEDIKGHFCETHDTFEKEALQRYKKEVLDKTPVQQTLSISEEQLNDNVKLLPQAIINQ